MSFYVCKICERVLDVQAVPDGFKYVHTVQDADAGHEPEPMLPPEGWSGARCDFCNVDHPAWVLPAKTFTIHAGSATSAEDWAACDDCAKLIEKDQWNALVRRVTAAQLEQSPNLAEAETQENLKKFYRALRKNITGALREL